MNKQLIEVGTSYMAQLEYGQFIKTQFEQISKLPAGTITDAILVDGIANITGQNQVYDKALVKVTKNAHTEALAMLDAKRDISVLALGAAIKLGSYSEIATELAAASRLATLYSTYGSSDIANFNYEKESNALFNLGNDLEETYKADVELLGIGKYVTRIKNDNAAFQALFSEKLDSDAAQIVYDAKKERKVLADLYNNFAGYVLFNAKMNGSAQFTQVLNLLNVTRKYYADLLAARKGRKDAKDKKSDEPTNDGTPAT